VIVTYQPVGQDEPQQWAFIPKRVLASRAEMVERRWDGGADPDSGPSTFDRWLTAVLAGEAKALRVLLWHLTSLSHPTIRFEDIDFALGDLVVERTKDELAELIDATAKMKNWPSDKRLRNIAALEVAMEAAPDGLGKAQ
jgi:hypothetical protein